MVSGEKERGAPLPTRTFLPPTTTDYSLLLLTTTTAADYSRRERGARALLTMGTTYYGHYLLWRIIPDVSEARELS